MYITHVTVEFSPLIKIGGLADVVYGLANETASLGHSVQVVLPFYKTIKENNSLKLKKQKSKTFFKNKTFENVIYTCNLNNLLLAFIAPPPSIDFFQKKQVYGYKNDCERFSYFSRSAYDYLLSEKRISDIIHIHEWPTAPIAPLIQLHRKQRSSFKPKVIFTSHNIEPQGRCFSNIYSDIGLLKIAKLKKTKDSLRKTMINQLKVAFIYSDFLTTVSPQYLLEIQTKKFGYLLEKTIKKYLYKFQGILNGIDYSYWNPKKDPFLKSLLLGNNFKAYKKENKRYLQHRLGLYPSNKLLVACITRLVPQKGLPLIQATINYCVNHNAQFVLLGNSPIPSIQKSFEKTKKELLNNKNISIIFHPHNEPLSHQIFAGADMIIVPSLFEPCGLTQMIALRYGTLPLVRKTGGLFDSITQISQKGGNGFVFEKFLISEIKKCLKKAFEMYYLHNDQWLQAIKRGLNEDSSWKKSARSYEKIYKKITR